MTSPRTLVLACGALINELQAVRELNGLSNLTIECLPASLHMHPERIPAEMRRRLDRARGDYESILIGYADCGTAGELDEICAEYGVTRLDGAHCYEFFAGAEHFAGLHADDPTVFYLTDFLARHFDRFVMDGLGITEHPQLLEAYFGNYTRVVYLAQTDDPKLDAYAEAAAATLGLAYERVSTGYGDMTEQIVEFAGLPA